jgi:RNA polymerase sigma-70 factor (ECF subfamily)
MRSNPDQAILERARRFETNALEEIYDTFSPGIYRYAFRLLGDSELARECMSETFNRFLFALKRDSGPDNYLQAYLYRIAHNWITDYYRKKVPPTLSLEDIEIRANPEEEPHHQAATRSTNQQLREALCLLTPDQRQVIVLKFLEDWENEAIAFTLNKPVGAIKALQHRGLEALRRIMSRYEDFNV